MLTNRDMVIFGDDWGRFPSTIQHLGNVFARYNRILWIGSLGLRRPQVRVSDAKRVFEKAKTILNRSAERASDIGVRVLSPPVVPFHDFSIVRSLNTAAIRWTLRREVERNRMHNPVLITSSPIVGDIIGTLGESSSHYFCLDDFTLFDRAFDCIGELEQQLLRRVDSCFAVSQSLLQTRRAATGENHFLPQGVDVDHFSPVGAVASRIANLPKPVVGFFGLVTSWVDQQLIIAGARAFPSMSFVVIGKAAANISALKSVPNIHYFGEVPFSALPEFARGFDAGLIPFVVNDLTTAANPLKLFEYLSMGIPVVSTPLPEVAKFSDNVIIAKNRDEFVAGIKSAASDNSPERKSARRVLALQYSWSKIADSISRIIMEIEAKKQ